MLIAGLFSNAAIARDGAGTASVTWTAIDAGGFGGTDTESLDASFRGAHTLYEGLLDGGTGLLQVPLPAGSRENQLMFSYFVDVNMAGGQVEIRLPSGWEIQTAAENIKDEGATGTADGVITDAYQRYGTNLLVEIQERFAITGEGKIIYATNAGGHHRAITADGALDGTDSVLNDTDVKAAANATAIAAQTDRASVDGSSVTVNLSNSWRSGGELVVILRNVETLKPRSLGNRTTAEDTVGAVADLPYANSTISVKSKRSGRLDTLDPVSIDHDGDDPDDDGGRRDLEAADATDKGAREATCYQGWKYPWSGSRRSSC